MRNTIRLIYAAVLAILAVGCYDGNSFSEDYVVDSKVFVTGVSLSMTNMYLYLDETETLIATVLPSNVSEKSVTWTSSDESVATVAANGRVTAVSMGSATITATSNMDGSKKGTCEVSVSRHEDDKTFTVKGVSFTMKPVEAGTFDMGNSADGDHVTPIHKVTLTKDYYIGETEVTQALWRAVTGYLPTSDGEAWSSSYGLGDNYPAYYISYNDVLSFIQQLNSLTGQTFRMPTEAEWEYAAKGGKRSKGYLYSGSSTLDNVGWYVANSGSKTHQVKTKAANELGIFDMSGNVWEWCSDWYGSYSSSSLTDPIGPTTGSLRVSRGGSWSGTAAGCRTADRGDAPSGRYGSLGFRLALSSSK